MGSPGHRNLFSEPAAGKSTIASNRSAIFNFFEPMNARCSTLARLARASARKRGLVVA